MRGWSTWWRVLGTLTVLALCLAVSACRFSAGTGGRQLHGGGVVFVVPLETSRDTTGPDGIVFEGKTVTARTDGRSLEVDGHHYGSIAPGDVVDLTTPQVVLVNGKKRLPAP